MWTLKSLPFIRPAIKKNQMALESLCIWLPNFEIRLCRIKEQNKEGILKILLPNVRPWDLCYFKMLTISINLPWNISSFNGTKSLYVQNLQTKCLQVKVPIGYVEGCTLWKLYLASDPPLKKGRGGHLESMRGVCFLSRLWICLR